MVSDRKKNGLLSQIKGAFRPLKERLGHLSSETAVTLSRKHNEAQSVTNVLRQLNRAFIVVICVLFFILCCYVALSFTNLGIQNSVLSENKGDAGSNKVDSALGAPTSLNPRSHYVEMTNSRNIFSSAVNEPYDQLNAQKDLKREIGKILTVVGILKDNDSTVIIEDSKNKETHFLSEGESYKNIQILQINDTNVRIRYRGEEIVMSP